MTGPRRKSRPDEEPVQDQANVTPIPATKLVRELLTGTRYDISEEDLNNSAVAKVLARMFMSEIKRCKTEIEELREYKERFHTANEDLLVANEHVRGLNEFVGISSILFAFGGAAIGLAFTQTSVIYALGCIAVAMICFGTGVLKPWGSVKKK